MDGGKEGGERERSILSVLQLQWLWYTLISKQHIVYRVLNATLKDCDFPND